MAKTTETLDEFYRNKYGALSGDFPQNDGQFNVFRIEDRISSHTSSPTFIRRDFYKIMLFSGDNIFHYGDRSIPVTGNTLLFFNPHVPYTYESLEEGTHGCFCVFKDEFFKGNFRLNLFELPLFAAGAHPVFSLNEEETSEIKTIFEKIIRETDSDFVYKYDLIKNYVSELIYYGVKLQPVNTVSGHTNASLRVTTVFMELLERQFPLESTAQRFELRSPKAFADRMNIHVNYLNRAIKKQTGRTTTEHIFERLISEAKVLLKYTDWNISEISYVLGFEDQSHFNNFFKKKTDSNPTSIRRV
ncbi:helix-turn-helix domain-containing protein [Chryseobacterium sp. KCF3-3]|uniref:helix-turn-helix domain-containing protein n=1 Tax=Chryseobacterium sp. KCF3-3 TaxID=3231511 RepID=UPI0038B2A545